MRSKVLRWQGAALGIVVPMFFGNMGIAQAQEKPVRIVVGFAPGGSNDLVARALASKITTSGGTQAIVDNRAGANGMIAAEHVARSAPDGATVILTGVSTFVLNPLVYQKVAYDTQRDLSPITTVAVMPQIIVSHPSLPAKSLRELADIARRSPGALTAAHPGIGGLSHLTLEMFKGLAEETGGGTRGGHVRGRGAFGRDRHRPRPP